MGRLTAEELDVGSGGGNRLDLNPLDAGVSIEPRVEAHDLRHAVVLHRCHVYRVSRGELGPTEEDRLRPLDGLKINGKNLIDKAEQRIEGRLDGVAAADGHVAMQDLLEHLGVGNQALPFGDGPLEQTLRIRLMRVRRPDEVHGEVGIDEDQSGSPR